MKKRVFIIHGWEGSPQGNWFPWVKAELEEHNFESIILEMPNSNFPIQERWLEKMQEVITHPNERTFLIGHSLGCVSILHYLETLKEHQEVGGIILVAGFSESLGTIPEIENFFKKQICYEKIKLHCKKFIIINSDNDPAVPIKRGELLRDKFNAKFIVLKKAGHINRKSGYLKLPIVVEELLKISN